MIKRRFRPERGNIAPCGEQREMCLTLGQFQVRTSLFFNRTDLGPRPLGQVRVAS
ncbi:MAG TPA: hypothetical protein QGG93_10590 [Verrucomicrobiota bacterium]|nr:hypothetical protein [Verrucomicrobiota bacterium]